MVGAWSCVPCSLVGLDGVRGVLEVLFVCLFRVLVVVGVCLIVFVIGSNRIRGWIGLPPGVFFGYRK